MKIFRLGNKNKNRLRNILENILPMFSVYIQCILYAFILIFNKRINSNTEENEEPPIFYKHTN